eukprot:247611_1
MSWVHNNNTFLQWLDTQRHDIDPLNDLLQLLATEFNKQNIPAIIAPYITQYVGLTESTLNMEISSGVSYGSSPNDNENCFMIIPPNKSNYQYTLKSFRFRVRKGTSPEMNIKFGIFDCKTCKLDENQLLFQQQSIHAKDGMAEVNGLDIKLQNGLAYVLQPDAVKRVSTPVTKRHVDEASKLSNFVKGFRFAYDSSSVQSYAKLFEAVFY